MVVSMSPVFGHAADFMQAGEDIPIQDLGAIGPVEALDVGILGRLARLDMQQINPLTLGPLPQRCADEFGPIIQAKSPGCGTQFHRLIQCPDHTSRRQAGIDLDPQ